MKVFSRNFRDVLSSRWGVRIQDGLDYQLTPEPAGIAKQNGLVVDYPAHVRISFADRRLVAVLDLESAVRLRNELDGTIRDAETLTAVVTGRTYSASSLPGL